MSESILKFQHGIVNGHFAERRYEGAACFYEKEVIERKLAGFKNVNHPAMMRVDEIIFNTGVLTVRIALPYHLDLKTAQGKGTIRKNSGDPYSSGRLALEIGIQLADLMRNCHKLKIFHGHIKPADIYFNDPDLKTITLAGFEISSIFKTEIDSRLSDLPYMPPECLGYLNKENRVAIDLYAIGAIMHELAFGTPPFRGEGKEKLCLNILNMLPEATGEKARELMPFYMIIEKLLRKNPNDRYGLSEGLYRDLTICKNSLVSKGRIDAFALGKYDIRRELNYDIETVGRKNIFQKLEKGLDLASSGQGSLVALGARSGIGKTRLAQDLLSCAVDKNFHTYRAKFTQYERNIPLEAFNKILLSFEERLLKASQTEYVNWQKRLQEVLGANGSLLSQRFPYLKRHFPEFPKLPRLSHDVEVKLLYETIAKFISLLTIDLKKTFIFLDDLQWSDESSMRLLMELAVLSGNSGMGNTMILCTYRSEEVEKDHLFNILVLQNLDARSNVLLEPLCREESDHLVELLLDEKSGEIEKIKNITFALTQGNPFHIYTYLNSIIENGLFSIDQNGDYFFNLDESEHQKVDKKISDLMKDRIAHLSPDPFHLIVTISVAGSSIPIESAKELLSGVGGSWNKESIGNYGEHNIERILSELVQKNLLVVQNNSEIHFVHDRVRDAAWSFCGETARKNLHRDYACHLVENSGKIDDLEAKVIFEIAFHIQNCSPIPDLSIPRRVLSAAGKRASSLFAYQKAKTYLGDAKNYFPCELPEIKAAGLFESWLEIEELLADAMAMSYEWGKAISLYEELVPLISDDKRH
ncbi:MAG: AAA family ATPase, partial [Oligoflexales bacterium]|nr:AAA family ATPase [Oligoflexales bacterium]